MIFFFVAPFGDDLHPGTPEAPFATLGRARQAVREVAGTPVTVLLRAGTYYLPETLTFTTEDSGTAEAPVVWSAYPGEEVVVSGGQRLTLAWAPYRDGILQARLPETMTAIDQLFINGERLHMARYPKFQPEEAIWNGWAADAISRDRAARWADPSSGYFHAMHQALWGGYHYRITGKDAEGNVILEGGWQNNRRMGMHESYRFVEHIFEELDAPGEWFFDAAHRTLFAYPPAGVDLAQATIEVVCLQQLVALRGTAERPVRHLTLRGFTFRHAARTFMETTEPLLRSDWTIYRGGAVFFTGTEHCGLIGCHLDQVGGNAVFASKYNRHLLIRACRISEAGASGVAFVGSPLAVRNPLFEYNERQSLADIDLTPGPRGVEYPADCRVQDCLISRTGRYEKQSAGIQISMASGITVSHCSIYETPRAGINISEGTWGGHLIEWCDVFDTVLETGDHGAFNAWGRDRWWALQDIDPDALTPEQRATLPLLDTVQPVVLRYNRWRCDHGWDIDLDDGATNYQIYGNLCLQGGIKNREGFYRVVENNIIINNSFHPHVWFQHSEDLFCRNIIFSPYCPIAVSAPWGAACDDNLLYAPGQITIEPAVVLQEASGRDTHSCVADARFVDPAHGDYRVQATSPAIALGFINFPMDNFGVQHPSLKAIARRPPFPAVRTTAGDSAELQAPVSIWLGATVKSVTGLGEVSATGLPGEIGVLLLDVPAFSRAAESELQAMDVILSINGKSTNTVEQLRDTTAPGQRVSVQVWRRQCERTVLVWILDDE